MMLKAAKILLLGVLMSLAFQGKATAKRCSMKEYRMYLKGEVNVSTISVTRKEAATNLYMQLIDPRHKHLLLNYNSKAEYLSLMKNVCATEEIYFYYEPFSYVNVASENNKGYLSINTASVRIKDRATRYLQVVIPKLIKDIGITKKTKELTAAKKIHDYIKKQYKYDEAGKNRSAYQMVEHGKGVCTAYAELYQYLCCYCGLRCEIIHGNKKTHEWNRVRCNGKWYYVDVTWDDTEKTSKYRVNTKKEFYRDKKHNKSTIDKYIKVSLPR